jgi:hypothetical protein
MKIPPAMMSTIPDHIDLVRIFRPVWRVVLN